MTVRKRKGRLTRTIEIPVCRECFKELKRESAEEEKMRTLGRLGAIVGGLLLFVTVILILPGGLATPWRILFAALFSAAFGRLISFYFDGRRRRGIRPEKAAIQSSASMLEFSWRAATFEFDNEVFAERFEELNEQNLMEY